MPTSYRRMPNAGSDNTLIDSDNNWLRDVDKPYGYTDKHVLNDNNITNRYVLPKYGVRRRDRIASHVLVPIHCSSLARFVRLSSVNFTVEMCGFYLGIVICY